MAGQASAATIDHKKSVWFLKSDDGNYTASFGTQFQFDFVARALDDDNGERADTRKMSLRRGRFGAKGRMGSPNLTYNLLFDVTTNSNTNTDGGNGMGIFDAYMGYKFSPEFSVRAGTFKPLHSAYQSNSSGRDTFVERGQVDAAFQYGRDTGVMLHGKIAKILSYQVGAYNGNARATAGNTESSNFQGALVLEPTGKHGGLGEPDLKGTDKMRTWLSAGIVRTHDSTTAQSAVQSSFIAANGRGDITQYALDVGLKYAGLAVMGEFIHVNVDGPTAVLSTTGKGFTVMGSYMVIPKKMHVGARIEWLDKNDKTANNDISSYGLASAYYFNGQKHKVIVDWVHLSTDTTFAGAPTKNEDDTFSAKWQTRF